MSHLKKRLTDTIIKFNKQLSYWCLYWYNAIHRHAVVLAQLEVTVNSFIASDSPCLSVMLHIPLRQNIKL